MTPYFDDTKTSTVRPQKCAHCGNDCGTVTYWTHQGIGQTAKPFCSLKCSELERTGKVQR